MKVPPTGAGPIARPQAGNGPQRLDSDVLKNFDASEAMKALDLNDDGHVSEDEFAAYRAGKQARGEFVPMSGPSTGTPTPEAVQQAMFDALVDREDG